MLAMLQWTRVKSFPLPSVVRPMKAPSMCLRNPPSIVYQPYFISTDASQGNRKEVFLR